MGFSITEPAAAASPPARIPLITGNWYDDTSGLHVTGTSGGGFTPTADILYAVPILITQAISIDRLSIQVVTGETSGNMKIGIYADSAGAPGALLVDSGSLSTVNTGGIDGTVSVSLSPGWHWTAAVFDLDSTLEIRDNGSGDYRCDLGFTTNIVTDQLKHITRAFSFAALPDPFGTPTYKIQDQFPRIRFRVG